MPSLKKIDQKSYAWKKEIDYRKFPEKYRVGKGEQGVLICEPYKSKIVQHWRFKTPEEAKISSNPIFNMFLDYLDQDDFVGADMGRNFLQMGFTRSRRYANYQEGGKYKNTEGDQYKKGTGDPQKIISAYIFYEKWKEAEEIEKYQAMKLAWKERFQGTEN